jgi:hypothetical protein
MSAVDEAEPPHHALLSPLNTYRVANTRSKHDDKVLHFLWVKNDHSIHQSEDISALWLRRSRPSGENEFQMMEKVTSRAVVKHHDEFGFGF